MDVARNATSSGCVFRGPLCAIDYRCPSYLADEARSFRREHAIFCSLAALSRATLVSPPRRCGSFQGARAVGTRRFKLFALCGSPMILAIILNSEESARKGARREWRLRRRWLTNRWMDASFRSELSTSCPHRVADDSDASVLGSRGSAISFECIRFIAMETGTSVSRDGEF